MSHNKETERIVPIVMKHDKYDLYDELRENQFGSCSTGAMYRILLDRGYEVVSRNQIKTRESRVV